MTAGATRTRPAAPDRPPPTHQPARKTGANIPEKPAAHKRKPEAPIQRKPAEADETPTTNLRGPTPDEILADPLVRTVLDVFEGEVKRIHPRQRPGGE